MLNKKDFNSSRKFNNNMEKIISNDLFFNVIHDGEIGRYGNKKLDVTPSSRKTYFDSQKTYLIVGGLGGFALELALWMAEGKCDKLLLTTRSGNVDNHKVYCINKIRRLTKRLLICKLDLTSEEQCQACMKVACSIGNLDGVFNLAMVIKDRMFENQILEDFKVVVNAKRETTTNLDKISRMMPKSMKYFVGFSSINNVNGIAGQTNYCFANSSIERICELRRKDGLHGLAIQWAAIADVGYWDNMTPDDGNVSKTFYIYSHQSVKSCLNVLDKVLQLDHSVVASYVECQNDTYVTSANDDGKSEITKIARLLNIDDLSKIKTSSMLAELGVDSLMAINIKIDLDKFTKIPLSLNDILKLTIDDIDKIFYA